MLQATMSSRQRSVRGRDLTTARSSNGVCKTGELLDCRTPEAHVRSLAGTSRARDDMSGRNLTISKTADTMGRHWESLARAGQHLIMRDSRSSLDQELFIIRIKHGLLAIGTGEGFDCLP